MTTTPMNYFFGIGSRREYFNVDGQSLVHAGSGDDYVWLDRFDSIAVGEGGRDLLRGFSGANDIFYGDYSPDDENSATDGDADLIAGAFGNDSIFGSVGADYLFGEQGNDFISGGSDNDLINGGSGSDRIYGGTGNDVIYGSSSATRNTTFWADITLDFNGSDDTALIPQTVAGVSTFSIELAPNDASGDIINGGEGNDTIYGSLGADKIRGGEDNDLIYGQAGADNMRGDDGNDNLWGGLGADVHNGGAGVDYARYDDANYGNLTIRLDVPSVNTGAAAGDTYIDIEGIVGGVGHDLIVGNAANNYLIGGGGNDQLYGSVGNDYLRGDVGADRFVFNTTPNATSNADTIADFVHGTDKIVLSQTVFAGIGATLDAGELKSGPAADSNDFITYNASGQIFYDAGGNTGAGPVLFATVTAGTVLDINDFVML